MNPTIIHEDDYLQVEVIDEKGAGGAHHEYIIQRKDTDIVQDKTVGEVSFQNGAILENGVNGVTNEALLAIVEHRLTCFQAGPFACDENEVALQKVKTARETLEERTRKRKARGVEGKSVK